MKTIPRLWIALGLVAASVVFLSAQPGSKRAVVVLPISESPAPGSAGLFVGVNVFADDSLAALQMAVNDAVAQAHLFVVELGLIDPPRCVLALSGEPTTDSARTNLSVLLKRGVTRVDAQKTTLLRRLAQTVSQGRSPADLLVVSFSTHGFDENRTGYVMPSDGLRGFLSDTAVSMTLLAQQMERSKAGKRLLLADACRERVSMEQKGIAPGMSAAFWDAFHDAQGQGALTSCDIGQVSLENPALGHGVFTYYLLEGLRGKAAIDARGFITLDAACQYVDEQVQAWAMQNRASSDATHIQRTRFEGPNQLRIMPLAVSQIAVVSQKQFETDRQKALAGLPAKINRRGQFNSTVYERVAEALEKAESDEAGKKFAQRVLDFAEGRTDEEMFIAWLDKSGTAPLTPALLVTDIPKTIAAMKTQVGKNGFTSEMHADMAKGLQEFADEIQTGKAKSEDIDMFATTYNLVRDFAYGRSDGRGLIAQLISGKERAHRIICVNNLKQLGIAFRSWAIDFSDKFPFNLPQKEGGTLELCKPRADGFDANSVFHFQVMSNEVYSAKVLVCPTDTSHTVALDFQSLQPANISYWVHSGTNVNDTQPEEILVWCPIHNNVLMCDGAVYSTSLATNALNKLRASLLVK